VEGCGRWLSARPADERREGAPSLPVAVGSDPEILALVKEREKARLEGEILELRGYMKRLDTIEKQLGALNERLSHVEKHLNNEVFDAIKRFQSQLDGTLTANMGSEFTCDRCGAVGLVSVRIRCTNCQAENWYGFYPK